VIGNLGVVNLSHESINFKYSLKFIERLTRKQKLQLHVHTLPGTLKVEMMNEEWCLYAGGIEEVESNATPSPCPSPPCRSSRRPYPTLTLPKL
jgi:hypothetical protein